MLDELMTTRVTSHIALKDVVAHITEDEVVKAIRLAHDTLRAARVAHPRVGVAAVNPTRGTTATSAPRRSTSSGPRSSARAGSTPTDRGLPTPSSSGAATAGLMRSSPCTTTRGQIAMKLMGFDRGITTAAGWSRRCAASGPCARRGAGGDAVVHGGAEELLEIVGGLEVEGGGLFVAGQQSLPFEGAGCAGGDGVEQALELGLGRCATRWNRGASSSNV